MSDYKSFEIIKLQTEKHGMSFTLLVSEEWNYWGGIYPTGNFIETTRNFTKN